MTEGPYARLYLALVDDEKFQNIYGNDQHFATWCRLLMIAEPAWPASAHIPVTAKRSSIQALSAAELIDLLPGGRYRIHGLDAERRSRHEHAKNASNARWNAPSNARSNAQSMPRARAETETEYKTKTETEPTPARRNGLEPLSDILPRVDSEPTDAFGVSESEARVFSFIANHGASIRPDQGLGLRLLGLMERRGVEEVLRQAGVMAKASEKLSDRQWVFGLEGALETVPSAKDARAADAEEEARKRSERIQREMAARRKERERWVAS